MSEVGRGTAYDMSGGRQGRRRGHKMVVEVEEVGAQAGRKKMRFHRKKTHSLIQPSNILLQCIPE